MVMAFTVGAATAGDLPEVRELLQAASLPVGGVDAAGVSLWVARDDGRIVGSAALEVHATAGVLRSVCVASPARGTGVGERLVDRCIEEARSRGLVALYLLTETAADWFPRFGFARSDRAAVPEAVARSVEFASLCPASAVTMKLELHR